MGLEVSKVKYKKEWPLVRLTEVCSRISDGVHFKPDYVDEGIPFISVKDIYDNSVHFDKCKYITIESHKELIKRCHPEKDDLLITKSGTIGRMALVPERPDFSLFVSVALIKNKKDVISSKFLKLCLENFINSINISQDIKGGLLKNFHLEDIRQVLIPVVTVGEQQSIVSKIEELFSELDKGKENLQIAQQQLKTYRQSVLKWAFEGKLTNDKVTEGELPEWWKMTSLGEYIEDISSGKSYRCDERPPKENEVGIVKVSSVTWGFYDEMESKTCFSTDSYNEKYLIKKGDFLFSRANTIELIGACVIVGKANKKLMLSDKILRFVFKENVLKEYVLHYLRSKKGRKQIEMLSTGNQDSMRNIGQNKIIQIEFPYCPIEEQHLIVQAIESRLSIADKLEESITQSLQQAEALRQSILKKAFEGKLI